jgi:hypothetical protein
MLTDRDVRFSQWINWIVPGAGMVAMSRLANGCIVAAIFAASANFAIYSVYIAPGNVGDWIAGLTIGVAGGTYLGAQLRLQTIIRQERASRASRQRREILTSVNKLIERQAYDEARREIERLSDVLDADLLVAYRYAQILTHLEDAGLAEAWSRVQRLDRHKIYRTETRQWVHNA